MFTRDSVLEVSLTLLLTFATVGVRAGYAADVPRHEGPACLKLRQACEAAGFTKGGHGKDSKGLYVDCIKPVTEGKTVEGVKVEPADIESCKEKREERKQKREERRAARKASDAASKATTK